MKEEGTGLTWKFTSKLEDLNFADDVALISSTQTRAVETKQAGRECRKDRPSGSAKS